MHKNERKKKIENKKVKMMNKRRKKEKNSLGENTKS